jgi:hypothetical protein
VVVEKYLDKSFADLIKEIETHSTTRLKVVVANGKVWVAEYINGEPTGDVYTEDKDGFLMLVGTFESGYPEEAPLKDLWVKST